MVLDPDVRVLEVGNPTALSAWEATGVDAGVLCASLATREAALVYLSRQIGDALSHATRSHPMENATASKRSSGGSGGGSGSSPNGPGARALRCPLVTLRLRRRDVRPRSRVLVCGLGAFLSRRSEALRHDSVAACRQYSRSVGSASWSATVASNCASRFRRAVRQGNASSSGRHSAVSLVVSTSRILGVALDGPPKRQRTRRLPSPLKPVSQPEASADDDLALHGNRANGWQLAERPECSGRVTATDNVAPKR